MSRHLLHSVLANPISKGMEIDDPRLTETRRSLLQNKKFLRRIYIEWYQALRDHIPPGPGLVLELGSGAGFFEDVYPQVIKSEIFFIHNIHLTTNACALPFSNQTLKAIVMTDVLHHISTVHSFFEEATRCLYPGGALVMIEPWCTGWSCFVYQHFHHEPFQPDAPQWEFETTGPLSGANGALPWIVFQRDGARFAREFPEFEVEIIQTMMPFRYLVSGGISLRTLSPNWLYPVWKLVEQMLAPWITHLGMFALIVLRRR